MPTQFENDRRILLLRWCDKETEIVKKRNKNTIKVTEEREKEGDWMIYEKNYHLKNGSDLK